MAKKPLKTVKTSKISSKQAHAEHRMRHRFTLGIGIVVIAVLLGLVLALVIIPKVHNDARLNRINAVYDSIKLPAQANRYQEADNIFGDKRPYDWDSSRTYSSSKTFVIAKTVDETFNEIDASITAAGFAKFEEPYPGSTSKEYHYKNDKGEYVRLRVSSKPRDEAGFNELVMKGSYDDAFFKIDPNAGPSTVILKVNLDDNNE